MMNTAKIKQKQVVIYTDGACKGNPGIGGWGALLCYHQHKKELWGGATATTNNRMEITAVIEGLRALDQPCNVTLYTDSQYVKKGISEWLNNWKISHWRTANKKPVKNKDLWQQLDNETTRHTIHWRWVKGHAGDTGNEWADKLANQGVLMAQQQVMASQAEKS